MRKPTKILLIFLCVVGFFRISLWGFERYAIDKALREIPAGRITDWDGFGGAWLARHVFWRADMRWDPNLICTGIEKARTETDMEDGLLYLGQNNLVESIPWLKTFHTDNRPIKALAEVVRIGLEIGINSNTGAKANGPDPNYMESYIRPAMLIVAREATDYERVIRLKFPDDGKEKREP